MKRYKVIGLTPLGEAEKEKSYFWKERLDKLIGEEVIEWTTTTYRLPYAFEVGKCWIEVEEIINQTQTNDTQNNKSTLP